MTSRYRTGLLVAGALFFLLVAGATSVRAQAGSAAGTAAGVKAGPQQTSPQSVLLWRVHFNTQSDLDRVAARHDVWEVRHNENLLLAALTQAQAEALQAAGLRVELETALTHSPGAASVSPANAAGIPGYACYRTVEETYADLAALAVAYPHLATWTDIGDSWEKIQPGGQPGYDIFALRLTNADVPGPKPKFIVMAAIHAREYTTAELATRFAEELASGYGVDPEITWLLDAFEFHLIPHANPDGRKRAEAGSLWRKNTNSQDGCFDTRNLGVDLNRNSSFKWNECDGFGCSSSFPCDITYRGRAPASEPETQAVQEYIAALVPDRRGPADDDPVPAETENLFISIHSYSELILFPWGWSSEPAPNHDALQTLARKFAYFTDYRACQAGAAGCLYQTDGATDDWVYGTLGVASYTFELGTAFFQSCAYFEEEILDDNLAALRYGFKSAGRPYRAPAGPEVISVSLSREPAPPRRAVPLTVTADDTRTAVDPFFGQEPIQAVTAGRYSVDAPSWITGTVLYPLNTPAQISTTAVLTGSVDAGLVYKSRHLLLVEAQDADGNWGVPTGLFLDLAQARLGRGGDELLYTAAVTNTAAVTDTVSLALGPAERPDDWPIDAVTGELVLGPGAAGVLSFRVAIPVDAQPGERRIATVGIESDRAGGRMATLRYLSEVARIRLYLPLIGGPGSE